MAMLATVNGVYVLFKASYYFIQIQANVYDMIFKSICLYIVGLINLCIRFSLVR